MTQAHHELPETPLLAGLTEDDWPEVLSACSPLELSAGETVFSAGDPGSEFFLIVSGTVQVSVPSPDADLPIAEMGAGAILGEVTLLLGDDHTSSARAITPAKLLCFSNATFNTWLEGRSPGAFRVLRNLANTLATRLRVADHHLAELSNQNTFTDGTARTDLEKLRKIFLSDWS